LAKKTNFSLLIAHIKHLWADKLTSVFERKARESVKVY